MSQKTAKRKRTVAPIIDEFTLTIVVLAIAACNDSSDLAPRTTGLGNVKHPAQAAWTVGVAASQVREQAIAGVRRRGEQDEMLKLEAQLPGFGGFYIDSIGEVVAWLKPSAGASPDAVRSLLNAKYRSHANPHVREIMAGAMRATLRDAAYTLSELVAIENRIAHSPIPIGGYAGVGTSLFLNRVKVGFRDAADLDPGIAAITSLGISREAILPEVWGDGRLSGTWKGRYRPTRGGITTAIKSPFAPGVVVYGSHGYNVRADDNQDYMLLAAHQANSLRGLNGVTGDQLYQPDTTDPFNAIATVTLNPAWTTGATCGSYEFCTTADVAVATFIGGVSGERKIGTSVTEGNNGAVGSQAINNWYPVEDRLAPEFIQERHNVVHKSGQQTGTTTGFIDLPCASFPYTFGWGGVVVLKTIELQCHTRVSFAGWGEGDSGAPVFAREFNGGPYHPLGIQVAGNGSTSGGICNAGQLCSFVFARWDKIEEWLGHLYLPQTTIQ